MVIIYKWSKRKGPYENIGGGPTKGNKKYMLVVIEKFNDRNEKGKALINTDNIVSVSQQQKHFTRLYNENQELVSETEDSPRFALLTNVHQTIIVSKETYEDLRDNYLKDFVEIDKVNSKRESGKALIKLENVVSMVQQPKEFEIDNETGLATDTELEPLFALLTNDISQKVFKVNETEFERLTGILTKTK